MKTTISLKDDLTGIMNKLENLEQELNTNLVDVEERGLKFKNIDDQINELLNSNNQLIKLNIGGKIFCTKISTLIKIKDTLFYNLLSKQTNEFPKELFFDRSYTFFPVILDYLRTGKFSINNFSTFDLEDLRLECDYYGISEISAHLENLQREIEYINFESAPRYQTAGTHRLTHLKERNNPAEGICVQSPYNIVIELNYEHEIDSMDIAGWNGNSSLWYAGNGSGAKVYLSSDKNNWKEVCTIPSDYGANVQNVKFTGNNNRGKFIKFQNTSYLGIGYLKLNKKIN
jgi:hypothetical protein